MMNVTNVGLLELITAGAHDAEFQRRLLAQVKIFKLDDTLKLGRIVMYICTTDVKPQHCMSDS